MLRGTGREQVPPTVAGALAAAEAASPVDAVEAVTRELGLALDATKVSFLIADLSGRALVRLVHARLSTPASTPPAPGERRAEEESATVLPFDGGPAEQAVRTQELQVVDPAEGNPGSVGPGSWLVLAPVTERGEAIGVLELTLPHRPEAATLGEIARLAHLLAFVVIANRRHTDLCNARNGGASLVEQAAATNRALAEHAAVSGLEDYVTGLIGRVDLRAGTMELVNAGHVAPYLVRGPECRALDLPADLPLGLFPEAMYRSTWVDLLPGDRVVFLTDGMLERNAVDVNLPEAIGATRSLHPREAVRALADLVLDATGTTLSDDATVLCLDWHGGHGEDRDSVHGARQRCGGPVDSGSKSAFTGLNESKRKDPGW